MRKDYYLENKDKYLAYAKMYSKTYQRKVLSPQEKLEIKQYKKKYYQNNREEILSYRTKRYHDHIEVKLRDVLRSRLRRALKKKLKVGSAIKDLGCTIPELRLHLENKFQPGMTWDNWKIDGWHIDHIKPLASFDLTDTNQLQEATHFSNLQPLWWFDNLAKQDKILAPL
jgi:hypothetical protein